MLIDELNESQVEVNKQSQPQLLSTDHSSLYESQIPFVRTNFLQTTALVGERQYPRCMVQKILQPKKSYAEEIGFEMKKDAIGPCTFVGVIRPTLKNSRYYDWESNYEKNQASISQPFKIPKNHLTIQSGNVDVSKF